MTSLEANFPRGGSLPQQQQHHKSKDDSDDKKQKKKQKSSSPSTKKRDASDFLFGSPSKNDGDAEKKSSSSSSKKKKSNDDSNNNSKRRKKSTEASSASRSLLPYGGGGVVHPEKGEGWIESLGFSKLHPGLSLLGVVREVHEDLAVFSLPNQWTGFMLRKSNTNNDAAMNCNTMLQVGQMLAVTIVKAVQESTTKGQPARRRIQVTVLPSQVNSPSVEPTKGRLIRGQIISVEDHGFMVDLGWQRRGFCKFDDIHGEFKISDDGDDGDDDDNDEKENAKKNDDDDDGEEGDAMDIDGNTNRGHNRPHPRRRRVLGKGRILDFHITSTSDANVVSLELLSADELRKKLSVTNLPPLDDLRPGTLVQCTMDKMVRNGICVSFGAGVYRGAIDLMHLGGYWVPDHREENKDWKELFDKYRSFKARIIAVDAATKIVRLSLQKHLLDMVPPPSLPHVGTVHEGTVIRLDEGVGALLALPEQHAERIGEKTSGVVASADLYKEVSYKTATRVPCVYVHISKAMSSPEKGRTSDIVFGKEFAPSTKHRVRILNTSNFVEGIASGATAEDIVDAKVLSYEDILPGKVFKQVPIRAHLDNGAILVDFGMDVVGQVPAIHLFDKNATSEFRTRMRKVKFAVNAKIDVRVLSTDPLHKRCILTAKKSLVQETNIIKDFSDAVAGQKTTGFVSKIDSYGISVTFFNGVFGRVTKRSLRKEMGLDSAADQYSIGDVVHCHVVQVKRKWKGQFGNSDDADAMEEDGDHRPYYEITLSLRENEPSSDSKEQETEAHIRTGAVLPAKSLHVIELLKSKVKDGVVVPGHAIVEVKSKHLVLENSVGDKIECKLPFNQLLDEYDEAWLETPKKLDEEAAKILKVGEKIDKKSVVLTDPKKTSADYKSGTGRLTLVSLRPKLVEAIEKGDEAKMMTPGPETEIFVGAEVVGFVCQIDPRYGGFVRFLDGLTGLVPKLKGGAKLPLYATMKAKIIAIDVTKTPPKILLGKASKLISDSDDKDKRKPKEVASTPEFPYKVGDTITGAEVEKVEFHRAYVKLSEDLTPSFQVRIHCTMAPFRKSDSSLLDDLHDQDGIHELHPFYKWKTGMELPPLKIIAVQRNKNKTIVDVLLSTPTDVNKKAKKIPSYLEESASLEKGQKVSGIVGSVGVKKSGLWVMLGPNVSGFLPSLEISDNESTLARLSHNFPAGTSITCYVLGVQKGGEGEADRISLSLMKAEATVPEVGDTVVGRVVKSVQGHDKPALLVELRGDIAGRCCITELCDREKWTNLPFGRRGSMEDDGASNKGSKDIYGGLFSFKVLEVSGKQRTVQLSMRKSRLNGNLDDDEVPAVGDVTQAYVIETNKKGCFLKISRKIRGRCVLKDLSDGFLADPSSSYPEGRLVVGKVKSVHEETSKGGGHKTIFVDLNLRESAVADAKKAFDLKDIQVGQKLRGTVSRIEEYGVFVHIEGSTLYGLVHKSECSDKFVKDISKMYSPGDLVKVCVLKKDEEKKQIGLSMKASYFSEEADEANATSGSEDSQGESDSDEESIEGATEHAVQAEDMEVDEETGVIHEDTSDDESSSAGSNDSDASDESVNAKPGNLDMDVGFEWAAGKEGSRPHEDSDEDDSSSDESDADETTGDKANHSRKNRSARRKEEKQISEREKSLADGTADENPETAGDYERLVTSNPNSSELWIRYMAFHLSLADLDAARKVAERALDRIEFREEREKLNVWCALLTLEIKYGTEDSVNDTIKRACSQSNPKHVHLRACEIMEKELDQEGGMTRARVDEMYASTCKKFKSKKKVWIANIAYYLRYSKYDDALAMSKRALLSLAPYKHLEMMNKTAQLMFEHDRAEQARTIFDGLLAKNPKRLDLLSVYIDKEVKHGNIDQARQLFKDIAGSRNGARTMKLSEKQMKKLFKRWYTFEEMHGTPESCDAVKKAAIEYVEGK